MRQAEAAVTITGENIQPHAGLFEEGVVSSRSATKPRQPTMPPWPRNPLRKASTPSHCGAQKEDKESAAGMARAAGGSVEAGGSRSADSYLTAPFDGTIDQGIYPENGELVAMVRALHSWSLAVPTSDGSLSTCARGTSQRHPHGAMKSRAMVPGLAKREIKVKIYYIRDMGSLRHMALHQGHRQL